MKSGTDKFWNERAGKMKSGVAVNLLDTCQREMEFDYISRYLDKTQRVLEVGCGNGYSTSVFREQVKWVDAMDYSAEMVTRAKNETGETNNRFFEDSILEPRHIQPPYDIVICVRVLINLRNLDQQRAAVDSMASALESSGKLLLVEGFADGFEKLSELRAKVGMPPLTPNKINFYSRMSDLLSHAGKLFSIEGSFHLGSFDYLTRVVYPHLAGPDKVEHNSPMAARLTELARVFNSDGLEEYSRLRGFLLVRR
ncbi:class I SAM-dependent methyltransferase [Gemmatimonadota bacterium]